ncbi:Hypothetical protein KVN_LOCUS154 [uncultured virus]|nr:Hypothetical protein KVN_LOCUS154 [uncultured virus]
MNNLNENNNNDKVKGIISFYESFVKIPKEPQAKLVDDINIIAGSKHILNNELLEENIIDKNNEIILENKSFEENNNQIMQNSIYKNNEIMLENKSFEENNDKNIQIVYEIEPKQCIKKRKNIKKKKNNGYFDYKYDKNLWHKTEPLKCIKCGHIYFFNDDFDKHQCSSGEVSDEMQEDNIPTNDDGIYQCPLCKNKYDDLNFLGEHFILSHNDYESLSILDENNQSCGFPGFELLGKINMTEFLESNDFSSLITKKEICLICSLDYNLLTKKPIKLICCKNLICTECLEKYCTVTNSIICPFCKLDHTQIGQEYLMEIELSETIDKTKWIKWWERHIDIFL